MSSPKQRNRARRRAEKLMDTAVQAVLDEQLEKAARNSRQAIGLGRVNPRLWLDHGRVMRACGRLDEANEALRQALALAPTYAEAFAELASLQASLGKLTQALRLQSRAVELRPDDVGLRPALEAYRAQVSAPDAAAPAPVPDVPGPDESRPHGAGHGPGPRWAPFARDRLEPELREHGLALLPGLLTPAECASLRDLWQHEWEVFEHERVLDGPTQGQGRYRFFQRPLPPLVAALRAACYALLAPLANAWQAEFKRRERFPPQLEGFLERCHADGQLRSTPILLRYPPGGCNAPHRDIVGRVVFPFQLAVTLGPGCTAVDGGGEFRLVDARHGRKTRERRLGTGVGDGIVFCSRERPVRVAGVLGLQPVLHGLTGVGTTERYALGLPFHEHR